MSSRLPLPTPDVFSFHRQRVGEASFLKGWFNVPIESMTKKTKQLQSKLRKAQWDPSTPQGQRMRSKHKAAWDPETPEGRARIKRHSEMMTGKVKGGYHQKRRARAITSPSANASAAAECSKAGARTTASAAGARIGMGGRIITMFFIQGRSIE